MKSELRRPGPLRWLWYAAGGRLPDRYREWVLQDVTGRRWLLRHFVRASVVIWPLAAVWWLLPAEPLMHVGMSLLALIVSYFYSGAYSTESAEHRLTKHGFPPGTFRAARAEANRESIARARAEYAAIYRREWPTSSVLYAACRVQLECKRSLGLRAVIDSLRRRRTAWVFGRLDDSRDAAWHLNWMFTPSRWRHRPGHPRYPLRSVPRVAHPRSAGS